MGFSLVESCLHYSRENSLQKTKWEFRFPLFFYRKKLIFNVFINCLKYLFVIAKGIHSFTSWNISANSLLFKTLFIWQIVTKFKNPSQKRRILRIPEALLFVCLVGTELEDVFESWVFLIKENVFLSCEREEGGQNVAFACYMSLTERSSSKADNLLCHSCCKFVLSTWLLIFCLLCSRI
jgi:hypothetical protein